MDSSIGFFQTPHVPKETAPNTPSQTPTCEQRTESSENRIWATVCISFHLIATPHPSTPHLPKPPPHARHATETSSVSCWGFGCARCARCAPWRPARRSSSGAASLARHSWRPATPTARAGRPGRCDGGCGDKIGGSWAVGRSFRKLQSETCLKWNHLKRSDWVGTGSGTIGTNLARQSQKPFEQ